MVIDKLLPLMVQVAQVAENTYATWETSKRYLHNFETRSGYEI